MLNGTLKDQEICHNCGESVRAWRWRNTTLYTYHTSCLSFRFVLYGAGASHLELPQA